MVFGDFSPFFFRAQILTSQSSGLPHKNKKKTIFPRAAIPTSIALALRKLAFFPLSFFFFPFFFFFLTSARCAAPPFFFSLCGAMQPVQLFSFSELDEIPLFPPPFRQR